MAPVKEQKQQIPMTEHTEATFKQPRIWEVGHHNIPLLRNAPIQNGLHICASYLVWAFGNWVIFQCGCHTAWP